jgi:hypothetical protein
VSRSNWHHELNVRIAGALERRGRAFHFAPAKVEIADRPVRLRQTVGLVEHARNPKPLLGDDSRFRELAKFRQAEHQAIASQYRRSDGYPKALALRILFERCEVLPEPVDTATIIAKPVIAIAEIEPGWHRKDGIG